MVKNANPTESNLCLNRFATLDIMEENFGSYFMSKALKFLKQQGYSGTIVSWSDPRYHYGILYKACNFKMIPNKNKKDYIYIDDNGQEYHKSICRVKAGQSELEYARSLGLIKITVPTKQRWEISI